MPVPVIAIHMDRYGNTMPHFPFAFRKTACMLKINFRLGNHEYVGHKLGNASRKAKAEGREISTLSKVVDYFPLKRITTMEGMLRQLARASATPPRLNTAARPDSPVPAAPDSKQVSSGESRIEQLPPEVLWQMLSHVPHNTLFGDNDHPESLSQTSKALRVKTIIPTISKQVASRWAIQLDKLTRNDSGAINVISKILDGIRNKRNLYPSAAPMPKIVGLDENALKQIRMEDSDVSAVALVLAFKLPIISGNERYPAIFDDLLEVVCAQPACESQIRALGSLALDLDSLPQEVDRADRFGRICEAITTSSHTHDVAIAVEHAARALLALPMETEKTIACFDKIAQLIKDLPDLEETAQAAHALAGRFDVLPAREPQNIGRFGTVADIIARLSISDTRTRAINALASQLLHLPSLENGRHKGFQTVAELIASIEDRIARENAVRVLSDTISGREGFEDRSVEETLRTLITFESGTTTAGPAAGHRG